MRRSVYAVLVSPEPGITARFERRGVKVVALPGSRSNYGSILASLFTELQEYSVSQVSAVSQPTEESVSESLLLPPQAGRLCYFAVPLRLLSWYRENLFPVAREQGLTSGSATEVISPGGATLTKIDALIQRSFSAVAHAGSQNKLFELGLLRSRLGRDRLFVILEEGQRLPSDVGGTTILMRPGDHFEEADALIDEFRSWLIHLTETAPSETMIEPERLLLSGEYRAAVASAFSLLEGALLRRLGTEQPPSQRTFPRLLDAALQAELFEADAATVKQIKNDYRIRSRVVHTSEPEYTVPVMEAVPVRL